MLRWLPPLALFACSTPTKPDAGRAAPSAPTTRLALPGGAAGIGFDDLRFSPELHRVLAPAGRTGTLDLIDPGTQAIESIAGFSSDETFGGGHGQGTTSVDAGRGVLFATDRGRSEVVVVDPKAKRIVASSKLAGTPDYVRWVESRQEVWVTEPGKKQIEYFSFAASGLARVGAIDVPGGPESLVIDATRARAYTHTWDDATVVIDLAQHREVARWKNGCEGSRGIALDERRGLLFIGCEEGEVTSIDVAHDGRPLGAAPTGKGVDIIAYSTARGHLYVPGGESATLTVVEVDATGKLAVLGTLPAPEDAHCVTTDDADQVYTCDPKHGALSILVDPYPARRD